MFNRAFWKGRKVFLTGHTGFKGSWLSLWLTALGADMTGYALDPPTQPNLFELANVAKGIRSLSGDVRDFHKFKEALDGSRADVVIHMAAQSVVRRGYDEPIETYSSNVMGTVHLLEAVRQIGRRCAVVNVTSDKCYENKERNWGYRENDRMGGRDPYSNSKGCAELVTSAYRDSFFPPTSFERHGIGVASARAGNVIGGGDWTSEQLIPDLMRAFLAREACLIRNPVAIRPWQFVLEPLAGYLMLAERLMDDAPGFASGWNFGPVEADARPVSFVASELARLWGSGASWTHNAREFPHEAHVLKLDASKAATRLNWRLVLSLSSALEWTVEWYRAYEAGADLRRVTEAQVDRYESLLRDEHLAFNTL